MAMLAEKRRKVTYIPQHSAWSRDPNKLGQKMLMKMGWKPGQGLGVQEQGNVDPVRVKIKNDVKGLGCNENTEEWIKAQEKFNSLLSELHGNKTDELNEMGLFSLEEKSKNTKTRVHYHKFTRGKDLSRYTKEDLGCIFGSEPVYLKIKIKEKEKDIPNNFENFFSKETNKTKCHETNENILIKNIEDKNNSLPNKEDNIIYTNSKIMKESKHFKREEGTKPNEIVENNEINHLITKPKKRKKRKKDCQKEICSV